MALQGFEQDYGSLPQQIVPEDLLEHYPQTERTDSNYLLGQLLVSDATDSEKVFNRSGSFDSLPEADNDFSSPDKILEAGECHFAYISGMGDLDFNEKHMRSSTPVLFSNLLPETKRFDQNTFAGEAVFCRADASVDYTKLDSEGRAIFPGSDHDLLQSGPDSIWGDREPRIHHPLPFRNQISSPPNKWHWLLTSVTLAILAVIPMHFFLKFILYLKSH